MKKARFEAPPSKPDGGAEASRSLKRARSSMDLEACDKSAEIGKTHGYHNGFSLAALGVPEEAWPQIGRNSGKYGYTITAANGAVTLPSAANVYIDSVDSFHNSFRL